MFLKRGLIAEHGSSWILPRLVGTGRALDLLWASDKISANEALDYGLVERVVADESLEQSAIDYIEKLAVTSAPLAMAATKRLVYQHLGGGLSRRINGGRSRPERICREPRCRRGCHGAD